MLIASIGILPYSGRPEVFIFISMVTFLNLLGESKALGPWYKTTVKMWINRTFFSR
jgi:hypothetical protein